MTTQTKCFIETSDIVAIRIECCSCGAGAVIPLVSYKSIPIVCPNCTFQFAEYDDRSVGEAFDAVVSSLRRAQRAADTRKFKFALEIAVAG